MPDDSKPGSGEDAGKTGKTKGGKTQEDSRIFFIQTMGICFLVIPVLLLTLLVALWPRPKNDESKAPDKKKSVAARDARLSAQPSEATGTEPSQGTKAAGTEPALGTEGKGLTTAQVQAIVQEMQKMQKRNSEWEPKTRIFGRELDLAPDVRLLLLVLIAGALGSYVHAAQSFASFIGNQEFESSWAWWYVLRIPIGSVLAVFFYFLFRGGVLAAGSTPTSASDELNLFGIMGFSSLAGLFSKQVGDKLYEVFNTLFKSEQDKFRKDGLDKDKQKASAAGANPAKDGEGSGSGDKTADKNAGGTA